MTDNVGVFSSGCPRTFNGSDFLYVQNSLASFAGIIFFVFICVNHFPTIYFDSVLEKDSWILFAG